MANLAVHLAAKINQCCAAAAAAVVAEKGERTVVIGHDANGRITEVVKVPIHTTVNVVPSGQSQQ